MEDCKSLYHQLKTICPDINSIKYKLFKYDDSMTIKKLNSVLQELVSIYETLRICREYRIYYTDICYNGTYDYGHAKIINELYILEMQYYNDINNISQIIYNKKQDVVNKFSKQISNKLNTPSISKNSRKKSVKK